MQQITSFRALRARKNENGTRTAVEEANLADLPEGTLLLKVHYSSLNYKDALSATGNPGVTKEYPHTPGIDAIGEVVEGGRFSQGDRVIVTGFDLGMNTWGGFGEYVRVPEEWALPLPEGLSLYEAAALGTAGLTAALSVSALLAGGAEPKEGPILVTGGTGGVGLCSIGILARLGFQVEAVSGKKDAAEQITILAPGATIHGREILEESPKRPLLKGRWQAAVDTVGGAPLASLLRSIDYRGTVACCGNAAGGALETTVYPFILRGLTLKGVDSAQAPMIERESVWEKLAGPWKPTGLEKISTECTLEELPDRIDAVLGGRHRGRTVVSPR